MHHPTFDNGDILTLTTVIISVQSCIGIFAPSVYVPTPGIVQSQYFIYKTPYSNSLSSILSITSPSSLQRCASLCDRQTSCDGFYYGRYDTVCYLGSTFLRRQTTIVTPHEYRMYSRSSYAFTTQCPTTQGFHLITSGSSTFCLWTDGTNKPYFGAQGICQAKGGSLLYLGGDIAGHLGNLMDILNDLGARWDTAWGGAHQLRAGSDEWAWSYGETTLTSNEYNSLTWVGTSGSEQKCMYIDAKQHNQVWEKNCADQDQFICEIVLF